MVVRSCAGSERRLHDTHVTMGACTRAVITALAIPLLGCSLDMDSGDWSEDRCHSDGDCPAGTICTGGLSSLHCAAAALCSGDAECLPTEQCRLREPSYGDELVTRRTCNLRTCECDEQCPGELTCSSGDWFSDSRCEEGVAWCSSDAQCGFEQHCAKRSHSDCPEWRQKSACAPRPCDCDADCPTGAVCHQGGCDAGETLCTDDADCPATQVCRVRTGAPCSETDGALTTCEPWLCTCDEQCPPGEVCAGENGSECLAGVRCDDHDQCPPGQML